MRILVPVFEKWLINSKNNLIHVLNIPSLMANDLCKKVKQRESLNDVFKIVKSSETLLDLFAEFIDGQSPTIKYWCNYIDKVEILLEFLYSELVNGNYIKKIVANVFCIRP